MNKSAEKTTFVFGASLNPDRTSFTALHMLTEAGVPVLAMGLQEGNVAGVAIQKGTEWLAGKTVHTVTIYMNAQRQKEFEALILGLHPKRIIFNPGAENPRLSKEAKRQGIECRNACTLVMLNFGQF